VDEDQAKTVVEALTGLSLVEEPDTHVDSQGAPIPWVDYCSADGAHGFEMKRVVEQDFVRVAIQVEQEPFYESTLLTQRWDVIIEAPTHEHLGGRWRREDLPPVRGLGATIEADLAVLEAVGITNTDGEPPLDDFEEYARIMAALRRVQAATHYSLCMSRTAIERAGETPGVALIFSYGYARRGADAFARRVQAWVDLDESKWRNVVASLANGGWDSRHGVLIFDHSEPDFWTAEEQGTEFVPSFPIALADPIELWCIVGRVVLHQDLTPAWSVHLLDR